MRTFFVISLSAFSCVLAAQTVPSIINYQGRLTDNSPSQVPVTASVSMQFAIYDAATNGNRLWQEPAADNTGVSVSVTAGIFNYLLGSTDPIPAAVFTGASSDRYLLITLNPAGAAETLAPRQKLATAAYAALAQKANSADSATTAVSAATATNAGTAVTAGSATNFTGTLAGDVTGTQGATTVGKLQGRTVASTAPGPDQVLQYNGSQWGPATLSFVETDPKVGALTSGRIPRWNGTTLANGALYDDGAGKLGIATTAPISPLHVAGGNPTAVGSVVTGTSPYSVYVQGRYAYTANRDAGTLQVFDLSNPTAPVSVGSVTTGSNPNSVHVQGRYAYTANNGDNTLQVFDVSNPAAPISLGSAATGSSPNAVHVQGRYAYVPCYLASMLQIFDLSNPAAPRLVGSIIAGIGMTSVDVQGRYAYTTNYNSNTLQIIDISNPAAPVALGSAATGSGPESVAVQGRYAYTANFDASTLQVFDISNPAVPVSVGSVATGLSPRSVFVQGRHAYAALSDASALQIFDISNPAAPILVGSSFTISAARSVYVQGRYAYTANFGGNTLEIFDLGGAYVQQLEAGGIETGTLATRSNARVGGDADVVGGLSVGGGGINSSGAVAVTGATQPPAFGVFQHDNATVAWGRVWANGFLDTNYGVVSAVRNAAGNYTITLRVTAAQNLIPVVNAEIDGMPSGLAAMRFVYIDQVLASLNTFNVYITDGSGNAADNDFVFQVTGR